MMMSNYSHTKRDSHSHKRFTDLGWSPSSFEGDAHDVLELQHEHTKASKANVNTFYNQGSRRRAYLQSALRRARFRDYIEMDTMTSAQPVILHLPEGTHVYGITDATRPLYTSILDRSLELNTRYDQFVNLIISFRKDCPEGCSAPNEWTVHNSIRFLDAFKSINILPDLVNLTPEGSIIIETTTRGEYHLIELHGTGEIAYYQEDIEGTPSISEKTEADIPKVVSRIAHG